MARSRDGELFVVRNSGLWGAPADAPPGVVRISTSGEVADVFTDGLQAPNDVCFGPDRALYFTDPVSDRGLSEAVEGFVYRLDLESGACTRVLSGLLFPNGLAFSADATLLYVAESFASRIVACPVDSGIIGAPEVFYDVGDGQPDGFCLDIDGRLFVCVPDRDEIHIVAPDGLRRAVIGLGAGAFPTNCCFYGEDRTRLAVTVSAYGGVASLDPRCRGLSLLD
jgi:gluconolactonase